MNSYRWLLLIAMLPVAAQVPMAYVPNKQPLSRSMHMPGDIRTGHPEAVQMLVMIEPSGLVASAEVISGDHKFREQAMKEVKEWKFRPVLRDGGPVYAYASTMVDFWDDRAEDQSTMNMEDDLAAAMRLNALAKQFPRTAKQELEDLEQDRQPNVAMDGFQLPQLAKAAVKAEAWDKAAEYANQILKSAMLDGQGVHDGHMVLGLVALHQANIAQAKAELAEAAKATGSPVLMSFGPNMSLAKALLEKGERDAVLEYFAACRRFWQMGGDRLDEWSAAVKKGEVPNFATNLVY
jgi:hypothetical protein